MKDAENVFDICPKFKMPIKSEFFPKGRFHNRHIGRSFETVEPV